MEKEESYRREERRVRRGQEWKEEGVGEMSNECQILMQQLGSQEMRLFRDIQ